MKEFWEKHTISKWVFVVMALVLGVAFVILMTIFTDVQGP